MGNCVSGRRVFTDYFDFATPASWYNSKANKLKAGSVIMIVSCMIVVWFPHSLFGYMWSQVTVPLSHLINVLHSMKSSVGSSSTTSSSRKHKEHASDLEHKTEVYLIRTQRSTEEHKWNKVHETLMCLCVAHVEPAWAWLVRPWSTAAGWAGKPCVTTLKPSGGATSIGWTDSLEDVTHFHTLVFLQQAWWERSCF